MITTCAICGEHVGRSRMEGFTGWEGAQGQIAHREVVVAVHKEAPPAPVADERMARRGAAAERP